MRCVVSRRFTAFLSHFCIYVVVSTVCLGLVRLATRTQTQTLVTKELTQSAEKTHEMETNTPMSLRELTLGDEVQPCGWRLRPNQIMTVGKPSQKKVFLTIGIPSVWRVNGPVYLLQTIKSIVACMSPAETAEVRIVVFLADLDQEYNNQTESAILNQHSDHVTSGLLTLVRVTPDYYPTLTGLKRNFGDSPERVRWRSKQVADYVVLFTYVRDFSEYYLQLEDDVICAEGFVTSIRKYIDKINNNSGSRSWAMLEFSELGFIGKLFRSSDLDRLARYMMLFYAEQPVDWLMVYFRLSMGQRQEFLHKPTLFQHAGTTSSFDTKTDNLLKDRFFSSKEYPRGGDNPPATVWSTMPHFEDFVPRMAYYASQPTAKSDYFWATRASAGDAVYVIFNVTQRLSRLVVITGHEDHGDRLVGGSVELGAGLARGGLGDNATCRQMKTVASFVDGEVDARDLDKTFLEPVQCVRISVNVDQQHWVIFLRISVFLANST